MQHNQNQLIKVDPGLNYLIPYEWRQQFYALNSNWQSGYLNVPNLKMDHMIDTFIFDFEAEIIEQLKQKCNYIQFQNVLMSPQAKSQQKWATIKPQLWKVIKKSCPKAKPVITFIKNKNQINLNSLIQIQIIFCSNLRSDAFVGFLPKQVSLVEVIRQIGFQMGFVEMQKSKLTFPDHSPQKNYHFQDLQSCKLGQAHDVFIMAYNLERTHDDEVGLTVQKSGRVLNESNEAVIGDLVTMVNDSNRTLSTGAQTPFFSMVGSQGYDLDRQYRMNGLFGAKQPQQIESFRNYAQEVIHGQLISIPKEQQTQLEDDLCKIANDLLEQVQKKVCINYKEKQCQNQ